MARRNVYHSFHYLGDERNNGIGLLSVHSHDTAPEGHVTAVIAYLKNSFQLQLHPFCQTVHHTERRIDVS